MGKIFFVLITAALVWFLFKGFGKKAVPPPDKPPRTGDAPGATPNTPERMVACSQCGVHMPESDSVTTNGRVSCREPDQCGHRRRG